MGRATVGDAVARAPVAGRADTTLLAKDIAALPPPQPCETSASRRSHAA